MSQVTRAANGARTAAPGTAGRASLRHELRTPLNAIIGYSEMLLEEADDAGYARLLPDLERVRAAGHRLLAVIDSLFDESRQTGAEPGAPAFEAELRHALRTPLSEVIGYTEILLEEAAEIRAEDVVAELERIRHAGEKLLRLVEREDGLSPASEPAEVPVAPVMPEPPVSAAVPVATVSILVADDHEVNRDLLSRRLTREGYRVSVAEDGQRALEMLRAQPFDLLLLDVMMPELSGYDVLRTMKADDTLRNIPVLMVSALTEIDSVVRCIGLGAEDYLPKPFNPVLLKARVGACLEKKRLRDREVMHLREIDAQRRRADELLHVILPAQIVQELKENDRVKPRLYEDVAVLFCDIVGFTPYCDHRHPEEVIAHLQWLVEQYEELVLQHGMQKIKTVGDSFMATAGLLERSGNPVLQCIRCGLDMVTAARRLETGWTVRIGVHVGPVVAGVLGRRQYLFDLWGDTVNTAARVEKHGADGFVNVSAAALGRVDGDCRADSLGTVMVKGKGPMELFRVDRLR